MTDLLNEVLIQQKWLLVRREMTFTVIPTDEKPDPSLFLRVTLDDLPKRGKSELVEVVVLLPKEWLVKEHVDELKKMLGPLGALHTFELRIAVVVRDTAGNILRPLETLKRLAEPAPKKP